MGKETTKEFYHRFKEVNSNPEFLDNNFKNPDFELRLSHNGGVKRLDCSSSEHNRCETNTFVFIRNMLKKGVERYYPVSGWVFMDSTSYFEHFWVYDEVTDNFIEITPFKGNEDLMYAYGGVINRDINDDILNAKSYQDIEFLKGKAMSSLYQKFNDKPSVPKFNQPSGRDDNAENNFEFILKNPKYSDLKDFIMSNNISDIKELKTYVHKIKDARNNSRNNREFNLYDKLITQIEGLSESNQNRITINLREALERFKK